MRLAEESGLRERTEAMFRGDRINVSENRSVLHVALRMPRSESLVVAGVDVVAEVNDLIDRMFAFSDRVRSGEWKGHTGKPIRDVINVGIGGSDLGPVMVYEALRHYSRREMTFRFGSNVDSTDFAEATRDLSAEEAYGGSSRSTSGGVELGKVLAQRIIPELESGEESELRHGSSTNALIRRYRGMR